MPDYDHDDVDRLTSLIPPWLGQQGYYVGNLTYPVVRERAQGGAILAHQSSNHIWQFKRRDTPAIAVALRLKRRTAAPPTDCSVPRQAA
jgi:hypothetical protein